MLSYQRRLSTKALNDGRVEVHEDAVLGEAPANAHTPNQDPRETIDSSPLVQATPFDNLP